MKNNGNSMPHIVWIASLICLCVFTSLSCRTSTPVELEGTPPIKNYINDAELAKRIDAFLQVQLAQLPTRLEQLDSLAKESMDRTSLSSAMIKQDWPLAGIRCVSLNSSWPMP
jgi:hypothetical protein